MTGRVWVAMQDLGIISPGLEEFRELATHSRVIPVRLKVLAVEVPSLRHRREDVLEARKHHQLGADARDRGSHRRQNCGGNPGTDSRGRRRDRSARGAGEQPQHEIGEQNAEQNEKKGNRSRGQFSHQAAAEHHDDGNILTFSG